ncbi:hypothetical protein GGI15_003829 [Coemansia interrupta]|uniref:Uncharacterized protein n=1 Tax=Coemansia interrupta TaxID=1126814 RepID=A0A9W8H7N4_9FUNG|nr:hypothetical protein GGI15_003829 [Coemansia interrupta]
MPSQASRAPQYLTVAEKKADLHKLYRRARHLDRKWSIGCHKPDEFTLLALIPFVGDYMSTTLAIGYIRQIHHTFVLSDDVEKQMVDKVIINFVISVIPLVGWILRRIYGVNKRNYRIVEKYILATASREEVPQPSSNKNVAKSKGHR